MLRLLVKIGSVFLVAVGIAHAIHVTQAHDVEYYLLIVSTGLFAQGILTLVCLRQKSGNKST